MLRFLPRMLCIACCLCALTIILSRSDVGSAQSILDLSVVLIEFDAESELVELASRIDIWEVREGSVVALVSSDEMMWLIDKQYRVIKDPAFDQHLNTIPGYSCYRTIDEQYALLDSWMTLYPELARVSIIGQSYEGREIRVLQLTNRMMPGPKPVLFLMANIHGRELITNETALAFAHFMLEDYGIDPDVTWLLNEHAIYIIVSANPDGHVKNEPGEPWTWWRKNTHPYGSCGALSYGVDLNRNNDFMWGSGSMYPCDETYQGPEAVSEPESAAIADFLRILFPDQRGVGINDPAPDDTSGLFISLHSYGNLVMWPWGYTHIDAPNGAQLAALGSKLASLNGYTAQQSSKLYPVTGTTTDFAYGELGVASFLFELGSNLDGFYPSCSRYNAIIGPNLQALLYATKIARTPYITSFGPDVSEIDLTPSIITNDTDVIVSATVDDSHNGNDMITIVELYIDIPPWRESEPRLMDAVEEMFDTSVEKVLMNLPVQQLLPGRHTVYVRGMDSLGYWGPVSAAFLDIITPTFELELAYNHGYGPPDFTLAYTLTLTNTTPLTQTFFLTGTETKWNTHFTPSPVMLPSMDHRTLTTTVLIPPLNNLPAAGYEEQFTLYVTSISTPSVMHRAQITTHMLHQSAYIPFMLRTR